MDSASPSCTENQLRSRSFGIIVSEPIFEMSLCKCRNGLWVVSLWCWPLPWRPCLGWCGSSVRRGLCHRHPCIYMVPPAMLISEQWDFLRGGSGLPRGISQEDSADAVAMYELVKVMWHFPPWPPTREVTQFCSGSRGGAWTPPLDRGVARFWKSVWQG